MKSICIEDVTVEIKNSIRWLRYNLAAARNGQLKTTIPDGKIFALNHSISIYRVGMVIKHCGIPHGIPW